METNQTDITKKSCEELLNQLQEVVNSLESGKLTLEESVTYYKLGISLSLECKKRLEDAKQVVIKKVNENGTEENFNS